MTKLCFASPRQWWRGCECNQRTILYSLLMLPRADAVVGGAFRRGGPPADLVSVAAGRDAAAAPVRDGTTGGAAEPVRAGTPGAADPVRLGIAGASEEVMRAGTDADLAPSRAAAPVRDGTAGGGAATVRSVRPAGAPLDPASSVSDTVRFPAASVSMIDPSGLVCLRLPSIRTTSTVPHYAESGASEKGGRGPTNAWSEWSVSQPGWGVSIVSRADEVRESEASEVRRACRRS